MYFTDAHEELRQHIRRFLEKEVQPHLEEWEEKTFPDSIFERFGELGFLGLRYPPEYGGQGGDYFSAVVLSEELARVGSGGLGMAVAVQTEMATPPVFKFGTEEQKRRWLAPAIRGEQIASIAITEPDAGSDVAGITTVARRFGDEFIVNGRKTFITNGARCRWALVCGQLDEVSRRRPISIRHSAELIAKVARTVHYAHEHGILHRDIKPGNILLDDKDEPHLTDFGLARLVETESTMTRTLEVLGTPSYMAPEQAAGNNTQLTGATDVYGLGAVFYQLLTGQPPFAGGTTYETIKLLLDTAPRQPRLF